MHVPKSRSILSIITACSILALPTSTAFAAGFFIQEQSAAGLGAAFAGQAAMPRDASTIFYNPSGLPHLDQAQANLGVHVLAPYSELADNGSSNTLGLPVNAGNDGGNPYDFSVVPNAYFATPLDKEKKLWAGFGLSAPFGLSNEYNDQWFGRFDSTSSELTTLDLQPSIAYKPTDWLSVGVTGIAQYADAELESRTFDSTVPTEADQVIKGDDWSYGYNVGIMLKPQAATRFGASYRSEINHTLEGSFRINNGKSDAQAELNLPAIASFGLAHDFNDRWTGLLGAKWFGWNSFQEIDVNVDNVGAVPALTGTQPAPVVQNYKTTWAFSAGAEYKYSDQWTLRGGYQFDETPTRDKYRTTRTPDGDRNWFALGTTYKMNSRWSFDLSATHILIEQEKVNVDRVSGNANVQADIENNNVSILSFGVNYKF